MFTDELVVAPGPSTPEDFVVDEIPLYEPSGSGPHTFVRVEKRGRTTQQIARALARGAGVASRDVGYAGRKDRRAVTRQWFSVPELDPERALELELPDARVLEAARHGHKLRTGQLRGNRFEIAVRELSPERADRARARLNGLVTLGLPNRFGSQRFGREGENAGRGLELLLGDARVRDRREARFLVSALQAAVFNRVLALRPLPIDDVELGDVAQVRSSGGLFVVEDPQRERSRAQAFEISATGPIFGTRVLEPTGAPAERERRVLTEFGLDTSSLSPPRGLRLRGARRPFRVRIDDPSASYGDGVLRLGFALPAGAYATVLLEELLR